MKTGRGLGVETPRTSTLGPVEHKLYALTVRLPYSEGNSGRITFGNKGTEFLLNIFFFVYMLPLCSLWLTLLLWGWNPYFPPKRW